MKVLIGYDGADSGEAIFDDLKLAGLPRDSEATIVSVADFFVDNPPVSEFDMISAASRRVEMILKQAETRRRKILEETKETATKAADRLREQFPGWKIETQILNGTPAWELIGTANDMNADLIVVGSQGRSAIGRFFLGSVSKKIATDARCSVRVARIAASAMPKNEGELPRIIIGVDGSPAAEEAVYAVGRRIWQTGTEIKLVAVDDTTPPTQISARLPQAAAMIDSYFQGRETRVSTMLDWATEELNNIGLKTSVLTLKGDPKTILPEEAQKWNADSIFVGTRDFKSAFERFRLGSVSTAVVTNAPCSVEIVRPSMPEI